MIFVIGKKLRKMIPEGVLDNSSDPLARDHSYTWGSNITGEFVLHEPADSDKSIWCAELTTAGRGARRKSGIVLMSANCGFAVITSLPPIPTTCSSDELEQMSWEDRRRVEQENKEKMRTYRAELEAVFMNAIRAGLLSFSLPENRVLDYTDTVARIELVKGRMSTAAVRLEELIERELKWENGDDPIKQFNIRGNWTSRKYGNSGDYRHVDAAVQQMLGMNTEESAQWLMGFLAPMREKMTAGEM